jgi:hypothetical protein
VATIATATYHIVVSNFYLGAWYQAVLFIVLAIAVSSARAWWVKLGQLPIVRTGAYLVVSVIVAAVFTAIRNLPE